MIICCFNDNIYCLHCFSHTVTVTESLLKDMVSHSVVIQFWDNKEKCSNHARSDKSKAFRLPADKPGNSHISEVPDSVLLNI